MNESKVLAGEGGGTSNLKRMGDNTKHNIGVGVTWVCHSFISYLQYSSYFFIHVYIHVEFIEKVFYSVLHTALISTQISDTMSEEKYTHSIIT